VRNTARHDRLASFTDLECSPSNFGPSSVFGQCLVGMPRWQAQAGASLLPTGRTLIIPHRVSFSPDLERSIFPPAQQTPSSVRAQSLLPACASRKYISPLNDGRFNHRGVHSSTVTFRPIWTFQPVGFPSTRLALISAVSWIIFTTLILLQQWAPVHYPTFGHDPSVMMPTSDI
jgi:hypothetical protein